MEVIESESYIKDLKQVKDKETKIQLYKKLEKIIKNPDRQKHLRNVLKGMQRERVKKFRLIYKWSEEFDKLYLLRFRKRDDVYE